MAKARAGELGFLIKHIEKIVLGVAVVALVAVVAMFVAKTPKTPDGMAANQMDDKLMAKAQSIQRRNEDATPQEPTVSNTSTPTPSSAASDKVWPTQPDIVLGLPGTPVGLDQVPSEPIGLADITPLPAPDKPACWAGWEVPKRSTMEDQVAAHVEVVYPYSQLNQLWNKRISNPRIPVQVAAAAVHAEVQTQQADGSWSEPQEVAVNHELVTDSTIPQLPAYEGGANLLTIRQVMKHLAQDDVQSLVLEMPYYDVYSPADKKFESWAKELPKTEVHDLAKPAAPNASPPAPGTPAGAAAHSIQNAPAVAPQQEARRGGGEEEGRHGVAGEEEGRHGAAGEEEGRHGGAGEEGGRHGGGGGEETAAAPAAAAAAPSGAAASTAEVIGDLAAQKQAGKILIWFHDTSLAPMKVYRYRVRLEVLNPLYTFDREVKDPAVDSKQATIMTPWSEWSDPVIVPTTTEFYLAGESRQQGQVTAAVFAQRLGQRVLYRFPIGPGDAVGQIKSTRLMDLTSTQAVSKDVDYSTGAVAVDVDFNTKVALNGEAAQETAELIYLGPDGLLHSKLKATDDMSSRQQDLKREVRESAPPPPAPPTPPPTATPARKPPNAAGRPR